MKTFEGDCLLLLLHDPNKYRRKACYLLHLRNTFFEVVGETLSLLINLWSNHP